MLKTQRCLSEAADRYLENEDFQKEFCRGCKGLNIRCLSFDDPGDEECPCGKDPSDEDCWRAELYEDIKSVLGEVDKIWRY